MFLTLYLWVISFMIPGHPSSLMCSISEQVLSQILTTRNTLDLVWSHVYYVSILDRFTRFIFFHSLIFSGQGRKMKSSLGREVYLKGVGRGKNSNKVYCMKRFLKYFEMVDVTHQNKTWGFSLPLYAPKHKCTNMHMGTHIITGVMSQSLNSIRLNGLTVQNVLWASRTLKGSLSNITVQKWFKIMVRAQVHIQCNNIHISKENISISH